jgi:hypothetical protein
VKTGSHVQAGKPKRMILSAPPHPGLSYLQNFPRCANSAEGNLFKASHSQCARCSGRQVYAASLYEWTAIIDSDSGASSA